MKRPDIKTSKQVVPIIYCYTHPDYPKHNGCSKIGQSEQDAVTRIGQQNNTADVDTKLEWTENAVYAGTNERFSDHDFHAYLTKQSVERLTRVDENGKTKNTEWFRIEPAPAFAKLSEFRINKGIIKLNDVIPYDLRDEQEKAVAMTVDYYGENVEGEFLWNAKPRFGKTLSVYDFVKRINAGKVLVVTNRPAIANSWFNDYSKFVGTKNGYYFVSEVEALKNKAGVLSRQEFISEVILNNDIDADKKKCIEFVSLQDLKGSIHFGGDYNKLEEVANMEWDVLVIDEAHEGVDTYRTDIAFNQIKRRFTLHLSGTPFKALANDKFNSDAIFNWTYADEQRAKKNWNDPEQENPYQNLPKLSLYTYQMSEIVRDQMAKGITINDEVEEYAFDLNEFFKVNEGGKFVYNDSVDKFLDAMTKQEKFPFSTEELRDELKHTFWLLDRVDSAKALARKLEAHPVFSEYKIVLAAGNGKIDDSDETKKSYDKVVEAIQSNDKTITLSVGQLTTGITIPEWTAVLMLSNIKSPALYMQAAFRAQNPCLFTNGDEFWRKENAYVFDFDPARTLIIFEEFANDLSINTSGGKGDIGERKENIRELLNFFPVIGEDEEGELIELDAEKVLSIPRKIKATEVVNRGFMSNFLFQNIANIFNAPKAVTEIIENFEPVAEPKSKKPDIAQEIEDSDLPLDDNGEVDISDEYVIGQEANLFGDKIYEVFDTIETIIDEIEVEEAPEKKIIKELKDQLQAEVKERIVDPLEQYYGSDLTKSDKKRIEASIEKESDRAIEIAVGEYSIQKKVIEQQKQDALLDRWTSGKSTEEIEAEFDRLQAENAKSFKEKLSDTAEKLVKESTKNAVKTVETSKTNKIKESIEDKVRDHLRGFTRTIPSFLMAYGNDDTTIENFDNVVPANVFKEVTGISLDQFIFLRDGGDYTDSETGEQKHFDGKLFDTVVFNDSVKTFLHKKQELANYFDEDSTEDIFDYIPPQKTNQIYTPKNVVKQMVDLLEQENPNCFDDSTKTFADLYMKSGLYITEIVKRLYNSEVIKGEYPDSTERLQHIFEKQVFGLAPTEIIYKIATNFILGFDEDVKIVKSNFAMLDALPYAKEGTLEKKLDEVFGDNSAANTSKRIDPKELKIGTRIVDNTFGAGEVIAISISTITIKFDNFDGEHKYSKWQLSNSSMVIE